MTEEALIRILRESRTLAVVGLSPKSSRASNSVSRYMQARGYRVIPVNPGQTEILGERCYPDLRAIPEQVDLVNVFRNPDDCVPVARDAVAIGAKVLWMQLGVVNEEAKHIAEAGGLTVVMDRCIKIDHMDLMG